MDTLKIFNTTMNKAELVARVGRVLRSGPVDDVACCGLVIMHAIKYQTFLCAVLTQWM